MTDAASIPFTPDLATTAAMLDAMGNETRLAIVGILAEAGPSGLPVGGLQERTQVPWSTLSHHIGNLVRAGLVKQVRHGRVLRCHLQRDRLDAAIGSLTAVLAAPVDAGASAAGPTSATFESNFALSDEAQRRLKEVDESVAQSRERMFDMTLGAVG